MSLKSFSPFQLTGRYAEHNKWETINGPGDLRVAGMQIIEDEGILGAWKDKVVFITGASSGMGPEIVRVMAATGATIFATARNLDKARDAIGSVLETGRVTLLRMDQTDFRQIRIIVEEFRKKTDKLNILINNAGVMKTPESRTKDGYELQFGTNHLSHFLLFHLVKDLLLSSSTPAFHSRVINVTSTGHRSSPVSLDNINLDGEYDGWRAYGASKTANIYMATQVERLYGAQGLHGYSASPGMFKSPNLQKHSQDEWKATITNERFRKYLYNIEQACGTVVYGAVSSEIEARGGLYLEGASVAGPCPEEGDMFEYGYGVWAFDKDKEEKLWELSDELVSVK